MRHHRRAQDAHGDVEHVGIHHDLRRRQEAFGDSKQIGPGKDDLQAETDADRQDQGDDQGLGVAKALVLQEQDQEHIQRGNADAPDERKAEEQIQGDGRPDHFGEIARRDGQFADDPKAEGDRLAVVVAAGLGEVAAGGDAQFERKALEQDRHEIGNHDDREQRVVVLGAARQIGGPVARDPCSRPRPGIPARQRRGPCGKNFAG